MLKLLSLISERVEYVSKSLAQAGDAIYSVPMALKWISREAADPVERGHWIETAIKVVLVLGLATVIELLVIRWLARFRRRLDEHPRNGWITKCLAVLARAVLKLLPIFAFAAAAYGILPLTEPREATRLIVLTLVNASVLARAVLALGRIVLSPGLVRLRVVPIGDETANYAQIWLRRFVNVAVYGYFLAQGLVLIGVPIAVYEILLRISACCWRRWPSSSCCRTGLRGASSAWRKHAHHICAGAGCRCVASRRHSRDRGSVPGLGFCHPGRH